MSDEFSVESVYAELLGRAPENKMEPRLAPLHRAMDILGEPNKAFPIIHVTGTNGKTSTARMIEAGLRAHGLSTGRYTSPHLSKVTERISIDGEPVPDETFVRIWDEIRPYLRDRGQRARGRGPAPADLFRMPDHPGLRGLRGPAGQRRRDRGGPRRHHRRDQRRRRPGRRGHPDLAGPHGAARRDHRGDRLRKGRHHQARRLPDQRRAARRRGPGAAGKGQGSERAVPLRGRGVRRRVPHRRRRRPDGEHPGHRGPLRRTPGAAARRTSGGERRRRDRRAGSLLRRRKAARRRGAAGGLRLRHLAGPAGGAAHRADHHRGRRAQPGGHPGLRRGHPRGLQLQQARGGGGRPEGKGRRGNPPPAQGIPGRPRRRTTASPSPTRPAPCRPRTSRSSALDLGFGEDNIHVAEKLDDALEWAVERAESNDDLAGGVLVTGSITLVAEARILLGKTEA